MHVYMADTPAGDTVYAAARHGLTREEFAAEVVAWLREMPYDERSPQHLDLYEFTDMDEAAAWLVGNLEMLPLPHTWASLARARDCGAIKYVYPGNWVYYSGIQEVTS